MFTSTSTSVTENDSATLTMLEMPAGELSGIAVPGDKQYCTSGRGYRWKSCPEVVDAADTATLVRVPGA